MDGSSFHCVTQRAKEQACHQREKLSVQSSGQNPDETFPNRRLARLLGDDDEFFGWIPKLSPTPKKILWYNLFIINDIFYIYIYQRPISLPLLARTTVKSAPSLSSEVQDMFWKCSGGRVWFTRWLNLVSISGTTSKFTPSGGLLKYGKSLKGQWNVFRGLALQICLCDAHTCQFKEDSMGLGCSSDWILSYGWPDVKSSNHQLINMWALPSKCNWYHQFVQLCRGGWFQLVLHDCS